MWSFKKKSEETEKESNFDEQLKIANEFNEKHLNDIKNGFTPNVSLISGNGRDFIAIDKKIISIDEILTVDFDGTCKPMSPWRWDKGEWSTTNGYGQVYIQFSTGHCFYSEDIPWCKVDLYVKAIVDLLTSP